MEQKEDLTDSDTNLCDKFWEWFGKGFKRNGKGRAKKEFYKSIKRGDVIINVSVLELIIFNLMIYIVQNTFIQFCYLLRRLETVLCS